MKLVTQETESGTTVSVNLRPSVWAIIPGLIVFLVGAAILAPDLYVAIIKQQEPKLSHLVLGAVVCVAGVAIPFYRAMAPGIRQVGIWIAPYAPKFGGGRPGDPQADGSVNPSAPPPPSPPSSPPPFIPPGQ